VLVEEWVVAKGMGQGATQLAGALRRLSGQLAIPAQLDLGAGDLG
jgi:hypothetical protein